MLTTFIIIFLLLWTIIGVGALILVIKAFKLIKALKFKIRDFDNLVSQLKSVATPVIDNKTIIVGILGLLTAVHSFFKKKKRK